MVFLQCLPVINAEKCETGAEGTFIAVVFNSDTERYAESKNTCDMSSAVGDSFYEKTKDIESLKTTAATLLSLRAESNDKYSKDFTLDTQKSLSPPSEYTVGVVHNINGTNYILKQIRTHCYVWLKEEDEGKIDDDVDTDGDGVSLRDYADYFNNYSWVDITENFYKPVEYFGWTEDVVNILFEDMGSSPAGYFSTSDFSNGINAIRINLVVAQNGTINDYNEDNPLFTNGTLTHELQHLVHHHYKRDKDIAGLDIWLNELCSSAAESIWAGQTGIYMDFFNDRSNYTNEVNLIGWQSPDHRDRYSVAALFGIWLAYQCREGIDEGVFFKKLYENMSFNSDSIVLLVKTLYDLGLYTGSVNYSDSEDVKSAWEEIYGDFLASLVFNESTGLNGFNGAWDILDPVDPDTGQSIIPYVNSFNPSSYSIVPSGFVFVETDREITDIDSHIIYDNYEVVIE